MVRAYRTPLVVVLGAYLMLAVAGRSTPGGEIFPFFSWDLFSSVPSSTQAQASVHLLTIAGDRLAEPVPLSGSQYVRGTPAALSQVANDLWIAMRGGDADRAGRLRAALERNHLPETPLEYALVLERFDPVDRFLSGETETTEMGRHGTHGADPRAGFALAGAERILRTPAGDVPVADAPAGYVEEVSASGGWVGISGWAGDRRTGTLPAQLVVVSDGEVAHLGGITSRRPGVAEETGQPGLQWAGFVLHVPAERVADPSSLRVLAVFGGHAAFLTTPRRAP